MTKKKKYSLKEKKQILNEVKAKIAFYRANPYDFKKMMQEKMKELYGEQARQESILRYENLKFLKKYMLLHIDFQSETTFSVG
jgi:hypothetical protein